MCPKRPVFFDDVLILILMEHAQRVYTTVGLTLGTASLNPYFNGTCSKSLKTGRLFFTFGVLILILMEHAQRVRIVALIRS